MSRRGVVDQRLMSFTLAFVTADLGTFGLTEPHRVTLREDKSPGQRPCE